MGLNVSKGNMYEFVTHTWNTINGKCLHDCAYCYMKQMDGYKNAPKLKEYEFNTRFGANMFIFVGSAIDLFAEDIPEDWILKTLDYCNEQVYNMPQNPNRYLFQSKNPSRILDFIKHPVFKHSAICTTIESNRFYPEIMGKSPQIEDRVAAMEKIASLGIETYVTIEPLIDFDSDELVKMLRRCNPKQINIGKNTNRTVELPRTTLRNLDNLIRELKAFTIVHIKDNLKKSILPQLLEQYEKPT